MKSLRKGWQNFKAERDKNRALIASMTEENRAYEKEFMKGLMEVHRLYDKDEKNIWDLLDNVRADILQAQAEGISAEAYFGMAASELAAKMISEMPEKSAKEKHIARSVIGRVFYLLIVFLAINLTPWFGDGLTRKNLGTVGLMFIFWLITWLVASYFPSWALKLWPQKTAKQRAKITNWAVAAVGITFLAIAAIIRFLIY